METAEVKPKRIKHLYPKKEIYHRFIHSDEYIYSPKDKRYNISAKGNYLFVGDCGKYVTVKNIENNWSYINSSKCIAIIDRTNKNIIMTNKFNEHLFSLRQACPDNYSIFEISGNIPNYNILDNIEEAHKLHLLNLVEIYVKCYLKNTYFILQGYKRKLRDFDYYGYGIIKDYVNKNPIIKKYDWYKKSLNENYILSDYNKNWHKTEINIKLPSIYAIIHNKVFNNREKEILSQYSFYYKFCYGEGIPFKDAKINYNKQITKDEAITYLKKKNINFNVNSLFETTNVIAFKTLIIRVVESDRLYIKNKREEYIAKSEKNRKKAIEEARKIIDIATLVNNWRENKINSISPRRINYESFIPSNSKTYPFGKWEISYVYVNISICFTQLKLINNVTIATSRGATVPLESGIKCFKLFTRWRNNNPEETYINIDKHSYNVGIYNLRWFKYTEKEPEHMEWQIQIGCHTLWLDDIIDFIHYYHLEEQFDIINN